MVPIDVTLVVVVVEGSFLEECLRRGSPHPACFNGERNKGDMCGRNILVTYKTRPAAINIARAV